ncbi:hypothetical protein EPUS_02119 [Endocarpon pusillum Z07020]|uniref:Uncharacterized protein n=1 Tax=Endocarpon pusillum (strain Z07020 / HMAS-L-300199) TaxID=1263415 RepID=U1G4J5_ENDPU|nr:uncharacterized protein EPUS_02119 [Endocarpon pusillum Z07020]ERF72232.1 hypothetical protein EPUS_02119 [Endocarpon pusillum Z07020]
MAMRQPQSVGSSVGTPSPSPAGSGGDKANTSGDSKSCGTRGRGHGVHCLETNDGSAHASRPGTFQLSPSSDGEDSDCEGGVSLSPGASEISPIDEEKPLTVSNFSLLRWLRAGASNDDDELLADIRNATQVHLPRSSGSSFTSDSGSWETISSDSPCNHDSGSPNASAWRSASSGSWASGERRLDISRWSVDSSDAYDSDGHSSRTLEELFERYARIWERPAPGALSDVPSLTSAQGASSFSSTGQTSDSSAQALFNYLERWSWPLEDEEEFFDAQEFLGESH